VATLPKRWAPLSPSAETQEEEHGDHGRQVQGPGHQRIPGDYLAWLESEGIRSRPLAKAVTAELARRGPAATTKAPTPTTSSPLAAALKKLNEAVAAVHDALNGRGRP
jgi:hypothetical protein